MSGCGQCCEGTYGDYYFTCVCACSRNSYPHSNGVLSILELCVSCSISFLITDSVVYLKQKIYLCHCVFKAEEDLTRSQHLCNEL